MLILGGVEDQIGLIVWGIISRAPFVISNPAIANYDVYVNLFYGLMHPLTSSMPIFWTLVSVCLSIFGPNFLNVLLIITILLNFGFSALYFKRYKYWLPLALIFTFCAYFYVHAGVHPDLIQLWLIPMFLVVFRKMQETQKLKFGLLAGVAMAGSLLVSNYIGYMIFILFLCLCVANVIVSLGATKKINTKFIWHCLIVVVSFFVAVIILLFPYIQANYFSPKVATFIGTKQVVRAIDDFAAFSSRPWYFFIPPVKNSILGSLGVQAVEKIQATGYYLADDYFPREHAGNYFGMVFLATVFVFTIAAWKKADLATKQKLAVLYVTLVLLFVFMLPPYFTISGMPIYTPGFLLYKFFPMFRVTARFSVVMLVCLLEVFGLTSELLRNSKLAKKLNYLVLAVLITTLIETFSPIKVYEVPKPPEVFTYLREHTPVGTPFSVYPYNYTDETFFWLNEHQRVIVNPRAYVYRDMNSGDFTKNLTTLDGITKLQKTGSKYLVVFKGENSNIEFFTSIAQLKIVKDFQESVLFEVIN